MDSYRVVDALTGDAVISDYDTGEMFVERSASGELPECTSVFFPGCSMINYAMPLVQSVYQTLAQHGEVDGISLLCCGKILSYEPDGENIRASFEEQLRDHVVRTAIKRFVCACPNCVKALREAFAEDPRTADIEIAVLPKVLADIGYRLDAAVVGRLMKGDEGADVLLCTHDSCPDREYGDFADGLRAIMPEGMWADPAHCRRKSVCCGSLPRAAGKVEAADRCADTCGSEAVAVDADAIVTACMSCAFQLNVAQRHLPAVHFLELLYDWRINWASTALWMKVRFLFDETLGATERVPQQVSERTYLTLGGEGRTLADEEAAEEVSITTDGVESVGL